jgi:hypothetical protein
LCRSHCNVGTVPFTTNLTGSRHIALITAEGLSAREKGKKEERQSVRKERRKEKRKRKKKKEERKKVKR